MRIKRLDICGFKSFMDRTVFSFGPGITAVVGPNGCGKSNVVDAIRWSMGEQSAKNLRGRGMEDVIFNGSETHAPLSMAEVTLTFAIEDHDTLPDTLAGLPEVSVTRRLFRNGESEYQINKTTCRLLDVTELFLGTGVGTRAYSIIEQGRVGQIVSARPEDRRSFIEEAAGITKYKARRKAAERKMEYTQQNLLRVNDIVAELEKRLDSLERQARKAEKYKRLRNEARDIELHHAAHRHLELTAQRKVLEAALASLGDEERAGYEQVKALEEEITAKRTQLDAEALEIEALSEQMHALERQVQLDAQNLTHWREDHDATQSRVSKAKAEQAHLDERVQLMTRERDEAHAELQRLGVASREDEVELTVREEELRRTSELSVSVAARLESERAELVDAATRAANHEMTARNLEARRMELQQRTGQLDGEIEALRAEERQLESARKEVLERVEQSRLVAVELSERRGEEEASLARIRSAFAENEVMVIALREELSDKRSRLATLEEIQKNYEGFDRGVRAVMAKAGPDPRQAGVFGLVADVVDAPADYEKAIEAALGERLQHVIVENAERGYEFMESLKGLGEGRSTFMPVPTSAPALPAPLESSDLIGPALAHVTVTDEVLRPLVEQLLSGVVLVRDLEAAKRASSAFPTYTFATLDGEVVRPGQVMTGGVHEGPAVGALQKKREISEQKVEVARIEERYRELNTRHYELQKQMGHTEGLLKGLEKNRHQEELSLASHEKDLHQAGSSLAKLRERVSGVDAERAKLGETETALERELEAARGEVMHGQADRESRDARVRLLGSEVETLEAKSKSLAQTVTELKVKVAASGERGSAARHTVDQLSAQLEELTARAQVLETEISEGAARVAELSGRMEETAQGREARETSLKEAQASLELKRAGHTDVSTKVREQDTSLRERREQLDTLIQGLSQKSLQERELTIELEHLAASTLERHQVPIDEAIHRYHFAPPLGAEAQAKLKDLRAAIEKMGEVNVTAIEEHQEIRERFEFLSKQKTDLQASLDQLTEAIAKIDETSRVRFKETFEIVNEKFQQIFPRLFGGGRASLALTQEPGSSEPGVEIFSQPPGKKLQSVSLLSGGEKALTAVALIFAIFLIKPTPFCLLDEVDAPLDEGNVGRYNDMVAEMSKQSQFILITHNKRTMETGDSLYGVTMEEPGVSKLVAVKLKDAAANTDQQVA